MRERPKKRQRLEDKLRNVKIDANELAGLLASEAANDVFYGQWIRLALQGRQKPAVDPAFPFQIQATSVDHKPQHQPVHFREFRPTKQPDEDGGSAEDSVASELRKLLNEWKPPKFDSEGFMEIENKVILEAKAQGKTFSDMTLLLPGRTFTMLRKQYSFLQAQAKAKQVQAAAAAAAAAATAAAAAAATTLAPASASAARAASPAMADEKTDRKAELTAMRQQQVATQQRLPDGRFAPKDKGAGSKASRAPTPPSQPPPNSTLLVRDASQLVEPLKVDKEARRDPSDAQVTVRKECAPPKGNTVLKAHGLDSLEGVKFYEQVEVVDPEEESQVYTFTPTPATPDSTPPMIHAACFNIGVGADGSPVISWSEIVALYSLTDGSTWAEHWNYNDAEDLEGLAAAAGKDASTFIPKDTTDQELFKCKGRCHSRVENIEYQCWIYKGNVPKQLPAGVKSDDTYYWRYMFDPETVKKVELNKT